MKPGGRGDGGDAGGRVRRRSRYERAGPNLACTRAGTPAAPCCPADFNQSGAVSVQDLFDFMGAYFAGNPSLANVNGDCCVSVQDIFDFLAVWFRGCN